MKRRTRFKKARRFRYNKVINRSINNKKAVKEKVPLYLKPAWSNARVKGQSIKDAPLGQLL